ncbi:MAG: GNAT family N-acetyltransferase [Candidatus Wallbacteria bacterium]|nr:GNAT family N-acetyltransferase [Candidatus Wallbacteria bacterium]
MIPDFYRVHDPENGEGWCNCVAWHLPTWDGWDKRTAKENRELRNKLFSSGEYDGYLLYLDGVPCGWCQTGQRDRLPKLLKAFNLLPDSETWAITCLLIIPSQRGKGLCNAFLSGIVADLKNSGVRKIEAYPKSKSDLAPGDAWMGPLKAFEKAGFQKIRDLSGNALMAVTFE